MYPRARVAEISVVIWIYGRKCTTFADANPSEEAHSRRDERGEDDEERAEAFAKKICGKVWWFGKKQYLCNRKTQDGWPEAITATTTYKRSLR